MYRTVMCNDLRKENIGQTVSLAGWVDTIRDHGGVLFLALRDETGITQVVFHDDEMLRGIGRECVISVTGEVVERDAETVDPKLATGLVEVLVKEIRSLALDIRPIRYRRESDVAPAQPKTTDAVDLFSSDITTDDLIGDLTSSRAFEDDLVGAVTDEKE